MSIRSLWERERFYKCVNWDKLTLTLEWKELIFYYLNIKNSMSSNSEQPLFYNINFEFIITSFSIY